MTVVTRRRARTSDARRGADRYPRWNAAWSSPAAAEGRSRLAGAVMGELAGRQREGCGPSAFGFGAAGRAAKVRATASVAHYARPYELRYTTLS
jgi:hypothetical protein